MSTVDQNKALIRQFTDAVWQGQDAAFAYPASDVVVHTPMSPAGVASFEETAAYLRAALPDLSVTTTLVFGEGDRVMQHYTVSGTHNGAPLFNFPPSSRPLKFAGVNIFRVVDDKIVERWSILDAGDVFQQLSAGS